MKKKMNECPGGVVAMVRKTRTMVLKVLKQKKYPTSYVSYI